jgi:DNA-3-methyladenine glycosylase
MGSNVLSGRIVETEAYFGEKDPASRAYRGRKKYNEVLFGEPGRAFIYMVHSYWLLNFVAHPLGEVGGVLIRAVEPLEGISMMKLNRRVDEVRELTSGPGKLTRAMAITKELNGKDVTSSNSCLGVVEGPEESFEIGSSNRIGVKVDLLRELRFFIKGSRFVSH